MAKSQLVTFVTFWLLVNKTPNPDHFLCRCYEIRHSTICYSPNTPQTKKKGAHHYPMSPEINALIGEIQLTLRRDAGVPSYDPADPTLPPLPTLSDAISGLDPALYLRCSRCRGPLPRGAEATVCIFCGVHRWREAPPKVLSFSSTVGYRNLLSSLGLDGSEDVALDAESSDSSEGLHALNEAVVLSDLLDLELRWPLEKEDIVNISTKEVPSQLPLEEENNNISRKELFSQSSYASNVSGVDLDSFFSDSKKEATSTVPGFSSGHLAETKNRDSGVSADSQNFGFLENFQSSGVTVSTVNTKDGEFGDSFTDWDADFQSAAATESKSVDLFQGSSVAELSAPAPAAYTFRQKPDIEDNPGISGNSGEQRGDEGVHLRDNWISDDIWSQLSTEAVNRADQFKGISEAHSAGPEDPSYTTSKGDSWDQDGLWLSSGKQELNSAKNIEENDDLLDVWQNFTSSGDAQGDISKSSAENVLEANSTKELNHNTNVVDNDDPFDAWQDFTSSGQASGALSIPWLENGTEATTSGHISGVDMLQDMDFGTFLNSDSLTGVLDEKNGYQDGESVQLDSSAPERMNGTHEKMKADSMVPEISNIGENFSAAQNLDSTDSNVQKLLSQMHDLSFMLENGLSIPKKAPGSGLSP